MRLSYDSIQVVFLDLLALQESVRIVNQFLLSSYLSYVCMNEPFTFLDSDFFFFPSRIFTGKIKVLKV